MSEFNRVLYRASVVLSIPAATAPASFKVITCPSGSNRLCCSIEKKLKVPSLPVQFLRGFVEPGVFLPAELSPNNVDCSSCLGPAADSWSVGHVLLPSINSAYFRSVVNVERRRFGLLGRMSRKQQLDGRGLLSKARPTGFEPNWSS
jgi:hypothetical protein